MDCLYFPIIAEGDNKSFEAIMHQELAPTYEEWLKRVTVYRDTRKIIEVKVKPGEFEAYLHAGGHGANMTSLYDFTEFIGKKCGGGLADNDHD